MLYYYYYYSNTKQFHKCIRNKKVNAYYQKNRLKLYFITDYFTNIWIFILNFVNVIFVSPVQSSFYYGCINHKKCEDEGANIITQDAKYKTSHASQFTEKHSNASACILFWMGKFQHCLHILSHIKQCLDIWMVENHHNCNYSAQPKCCFKIWIIVSTNSALYTWSWIKVIWVDVRL